MKRLQFPSKQGTHRMVLTICLSILLPGLWLSSLVAYAQSNFSVSQGKIYAPSGQEFIAKGANINGPHWPYSREMTQDANLIELWGFNLVRVNAFPRLAKNGVPIYQDLDKIVQDFTAKGMVVMIENHDLTGKYPDDFQQITKNGKDYYPSLLETKNWWLGVADAYKNNPYVWFNILNEPGDDHLNGTANTLTNALQRWKEVHEEIIGAIRGQGINNLIVADDNNYALSKYHEAGVGGSAALTHAPGFQQQYGNIVISPHFYYDWAYNYSLARDYIDDARARNLPVIIGEFGASAPVQAAASKVALTVAQEKGIGWIVWHWDNRDTSLDLTDPTDPAGGYGGGWSIDKTDGTKPTNLTWLGDLLWDNLRGSLSLPIADHIWWPAEMHGGNFAYDWATWQDWRYGLNLTTFINDGGYKVAKLGKYSNWVGMGQSVGLKAGKTYTLRITARLDVAGSNTTEAGIQYRVNGQSEKTLLLLSFNSTSYETKDLVFTVPTEGVYGGSVFAFKPAADGNKEFYWTNIQLAEGGTPTEPPTEPTPLLATYQAEENSGTDASFSNFHPGYSGSGYMDYGSYVTWEVTNLGAQKDYDLVFGYANGSTDDRTCNVLVNGSSAGSVNFSPSGGWANWNTNRQKAVSLRNGVNTIRVQIASGFAGPNLDYMRIEETSGTPPPPSNPNNLIALEAEAYSSTSAGTGSYSGTTWQQFTDSQASGGQYMMVPNAGKQNTGSSLTGPRLDYAINVAQGGAHYLWMRVIAPNADDDSCIPALDGNSLGNWYINLNT
ncbi:MAG: cellulase family glycosylhydrolase, partial [Tunicatimonas sp.]